MGTLNSWDVTDANNNATPPDGWPENTMQYSEVNDTGRAVQGTLKRFFADINGSLAAAGPVNAYTVTLNETGYTSYFEGMYFACSIPITNTGAVTLNVNAIGVQSVITQSGSALAGGELVANGIYVFRYDGTDFQLMGSLGSSIGTTQGTFSNANAPDLVDTNVALRVGAADPDSAQHLEVGPSQIQSKSDQTTAALLTLQNAGGEVQGNSGGGRRFLTAADGYFEVYADVNGDPDAGSVSIETAVDFYSADQNFFGSVGFGDAPDLALTNSNVGGNVELIGESSVGVFRNLFLGDPTGAVTLYNAGNERLDTTTLGIAVRSGNAVSSTRQIEFFDNDGTTLRARLRQLNPGRFEIFNEINGAEVRIIGRDNGGVQRTIFNADPDANSSLYERGNEALRATNQSAIGNVTSGSVEGRDSIFRSIGYAGMPPQIDNDGRTIAVEDAMKMLYTTGGFGAFTTAASTDNDFAGGDTFMLANDRGSSISVNAGSGVTLTWFDGAGGTTGNRTLADGGIVCIYRLNSTNWWIWGIGLS